MSSRQHFGRPSELLVLLALAPFGLAGIDGGRQGSRGRRSRGAGPGSGASRVYRGGGWSNDGRDCRSAHRSGNVPGYCFSRLGFRLVRMGS